MPLKKNKILLLLLALIALSLFSCNKTEKISKVKIATNVDNIIKGSIHDLIQIENLGIENDHTIPNLWGIVLGETSMKRAKIMMSEISEDIEGPFFEDEYIAFRANFYDSIYNKDFYIIFYCDQNYIIQEIKLPNLFMSTFPLTFDNPKHISVADMITNYGIPNKITIEQSHYFFVLYITFYYDYFTYSYFTIKSEPNENEIYNVCFTNNPYILISSKMEPFLQGPYFGKVSSAVQIEDIYNNSIMEFSANIVENPNYCLELQYKDFFELFIEK